MSLVTPATHRAITHGNHGAPAGMPDYRDEASSFQGLQGPVARVSGHPELSRQFPAELHCAAPTTEPHLVPQGDSDMQRLAGQAPRREEPTKRDGALQKSPRATWDCRGRAGPPLGELPLGAKPKFSEVWGG